jgi:hypothetical protein
MIGCGEKATIGVAPAAQLKAFLWPCRLAMSIIDRLLLD